MIPRPAAGPEREAERKAWLSLATLEGLSPRRAARLVRSLGSASEAWRRLGKGAPTGCDGHDSEGCLVPSDPAYPERLLRLTDPPLRLFYCGRPLPTGRGTVLAIVGTRRPTSGGKALAYQLGAAAASRGLPVASGLARGIDTSAHRGSLEHPGHPLAVLGCSLDYDYPRENARLKRRIAACGTLVSEYPPGTPPRPWHFPARNRILAALCDALVVVEAGQRSGALITADMALDLGIDVMAVPGAVGSAASVGTNGLLKDGAVLVRGPEDMLEALGLPAPPGDQGLSEPERLVVGALSTGAATVEELAMCTGLEISRLSGVLISLELKRRISRRPGGLFARL